MHSSRMRTTHPRIDHIARFSGGGVTGGCDQGGGVTRGVTGAVTRGAVTRRGYVIRWGVTRGLVAVAPPPRIWDRMTDACENITFATRAVTRLHSSRMRIARLLTACL